MRSVAYLLVFTVVFASRGARGDGNDGPLIEKGIQLRREHRDAEALEVFRQAHLANASPRALAQIALAEQALGQWVEAERDLRGALVFTDDAWISSRREALGTALEAIGKHLATLTVTADVASGEVWLNGVRVGDLPVVAARVPAGPARVEVRSKGYPTALRAIELAPGATATQEIRLTGPAEAPTVTPPTVPGRETASPSSTAAADRSTSVVMLPATASPGDATRRTFAWGALGAAGAFLGGAVVAQIVSEQQGAKYNDDAQCLYGELSRDQRCGVYRGQAESAQTLANIGYIAAGAFGIGSAILFLTSSGKAKTTGAKARFDVGVSGLRLDVRGTF